MKKKINWNQYGKILMYKIFENEYKVRMYKIFKYLNN